jgi:tetratricopeptide (TPR) repeat protein
MEERHQAIYREDMTFNERTAAIQELVKEWPGHLSAAIAIGRQFASRDKFSEAVDVLQDAIFDAQKFWPENFLGKGFIEAEWASNKNLLTAYAHVTVDCESAGELESAQAFASDYLMFNPKDGLGVRQKAIDIEMQMGNVEKALSLIEEAVDPRSAYNVFGRALVYYKLGKKKDADEALRAAVESRPLIYREMTNDRHRMPAKYNPAFVYYFSREEAFNYYMLWSKLWRTSHGAIAWLRKEGRRIRQEVNARPATAKS